MPRWLFKTTEERFLNKIQKTESCWLWIGATHKNGYGSFRNDLQKNSLAHRVNVSQSTISSINLNKSWK